MAQRGKKRLAWVRPMDSSVQSVVVEGLTSTFYHQRHPFRRVVGWPMGSQSHGAEIAVVCSSGESVWTGGVIAGRPVCHSQIAGCQTEPGVRTDEPASGPTDRVSPCPYHPSLIRRRITQHLRSTTAHAHEFPRSPVRRSFDQLKLLGSDVFQVTHIYIYIPWKSKDYILTG